ncbi:MAG: hypothetical protein V3S25_11570 [Nitrospirales bacterium]
MSKHPKPVKKPIKKPKRFWMGIPVLFVLGACSTSMIQVDAISDTVAAISERHDAYVEADPLLNDLQREAFLMDTEMLQAVIEEAQK